MIKEEKIQELVHQYTDDLLTPEEKADFEQKIKEDENLVHTVEDYKLIFQGFSALKFEAFVALVNQWEKQYQQKNTTTKVKPLHQGSFRRYYAMAAIIALLILPLGYWYMNQGKTYSNEELYAQHFVPYHDLITDRGDSEENNSNMLSAMEYYSKGYYENAIHLFEAYASSHAEEPLPLLYLGISYMETNQTEEALTYFQKIYGDTNYREIAEWYTALAYIKADNLEAAKDVLTQIAESEIHYQKAKASELLKVIK